MAQIKCGVCDDEIYPDALVVANHDLVRLPDGRHRITARDFDLVVHECVQPPSVADAAQEIIYRESVRASRP